MNKNMPAPWKQIRSEPGPDLRIFRVRYDWMENPRNAHPLKAVILEIADWVNVVAITPAQKIVVVHQYRFGVGTMTVEIPAGVIEPGEPPEHAARRELQEETGYTTADWQALGWVEPNPAIQNNRCHFWLATDVRKTHAPHLDEGEDIAVQELTLAELREEIRTENFRNALGLLALSRVCNVWDGFQPAMGRL